MRISIRVPPSEALNVDGESIVTYVLPVEEAVGAFEAAVLTQAPPDAVVVGSAISPDGRHGVALTVLPSASDYPMEGIFERVGNEWVGAGGGSGSGISWTPLDSDLGVLTFAAEAPPQASAAVVEHEGIQHRIPTRAGWFFFATWGARFVHQPRLLRFE